MACGLGIPEKAILYAEKAIEANNNDPGLYSNYALALLIGKRGNDALKAINKAIEMSPTNSINKNVLMLVQSIIQGRSPYPNKI